VGFVKENQWTRTESLTALGFNALAFGAAGYGLDEMVSELDRWLIDKKEGLGLDPEKDALTIATLRGGFYEMITLQGLGFTLDVTDRMGPASGLSIPYEKIFKPLAQGFNDGKAPEAFGKVLFGASGTTMARIYEAGKQFVHTMAADAKYMTWDWNTLVGSATDVAATLLTSVSNVEKALAWKTANDILNNDNMPMYIIEDGTKIPTSLILMKIFGFDPLAKEQADKLLRNKRLRDKDKAAVAKGLTDEYRQMIIYENNGSFLNTPQLELIKRRIALRKSALVETYGAPVASEIMANVIDTLNKEAFAVGMTDFEKQLFEQILAITPEAKIEKELRGDFELSRKLTNIKGKDQEDAD
jgi:hypothetical protein